VRHDHFAHPGALHGPGTPSSRRPAMIRAPDSGSPFNALPVDPPVEQFTVRDQVTHDKYGLGWVILVEDDDASGGSAGGR